MFKVCKTSDKGCSCFCWLALVSGWVVPALVPGALIQVSVNLPRVSMNLTLTTHDHSSRTRQLPHLKELCDSDDDRVPRLSLEVSI